MRKAQDLSDSPPSQRPASPPIPPKPAVGLRKKTLAKKSVVATIPASPLAATQQQEALPQLMEKLRQSQQQLSDWQTEGNDFIPLSCCYDSSYQGSLVLEDEVYKFLADQTKKVMLLAGHSGAGKSLFTQGFISKLWDQYKEGDPIPLWVSMPNCKQPETHAIEETLLKYGFSHEQIQILKANCRFIFIFDAVDEIRSSKNLWVTNHLADWNARTIFTCRHEYLYWLENFKNLFTPIIEDRFEYASLSVMYVKPFSPDQIEHYVRQYIKRHDTLWKSWEEYQRGFEEVPGLKELTQTPYVLRIAVEALPDIMKRYEGIEPEKKKELTKAVLYDVFVERWFIRQERKLKDQGAISEQASMLFEFWDYAISLAQLMHEQQKCQVYYEPTEADIFDHSSNTSDENPFSRFFDPSNLRNQLLQSSCFIRQSGENLFAFAHKSLFDYFVSKGISDCSLKAAQQREQPKEYRPRKDSINLALLEESQVNFLAERVKENDEYKEYMQNWLYSSRGNSANAIASANAITVLVKAGVTFNGADLSYLYLNGANISGGYFDRANFEGSDLENVIMHRVWIREANLRGCNLKGIDFGEYPCFSFNNNVTDFIYRPDVNLLVVAIKNTVTLLNLETGEYISELKGHDSLIRTMSMSKTGYTLATSDEQGTVIVWHLRTTKIRKKISIDAKINSTDLNDTGNIIAMGNEDGTVKIINFNRNKEDTIKVHEKEVYGVFLRDNGNILLTASAGGVKYFNIKTGQEIYLCNYSGGNISFSARNNVLVFGEGKKIIIVDIVDGSANDRAIGLSYGENKIQRHCVSSDGSMIISSDNVSFSMDEVHRLPQIRIWDRQSGASTVLHGIDTDVKKIRLSQDDFTLAILIGGKIQIRNIKAGNYSDVSRGHEASVIGVSMSADGRLLASASREGTVYIWDLSNGESKLHESSDIPFDSVALSPDGTYVAYEYGPYCVSVDNLLGKSGKSSGGGVGRIMSVCISNNANKVLFGTDYAGMCAEFLDYEKDKHEYLFYNGKIYSVHISKNEMYFAIGGDNSIIVYKTEDPGHPYYKCGYYGNVFCVYLSNTGMKLAAGGSDTIVKVWNIMKDTCVELRGHDAEVRGVVLSPDEKTVVSASKDKTIRVWDLKSTRQKAIITVNSRINSLSAQENLETLAVGLENSFIQVYQRMNTQGTLWQLKWASGFPHPNIELHLSDSDFRNCEGLTNKNFRLLEQRGAILKNKKVSSFAYISNKNGSPIYQQQKGQLFLEALKDVLSERSIDHLSFLADVLDLSPIFRYKNINVLQLARKLASADSDLIDALKRSNSDWLIAGVCGKRKLINKAISDETKDSDEQYDIICSVLIGYAFSGLDDLDPFLNDKDLIDENLFKKLIRFSLVGGNIKTFKNLKAKCTDHYSNLFPDDKKSENEDTLMCYVMSGSDEKAVDQLFDLFYGELDHENRFAAALKHCSWSLSRGTSDSIVGILFQKMEFDPSVECNEAVYMRFLPSIFGLILRNGDLVACKDAKKILQEKYNQDISIKPKDAIASGSSNVFWYCVDNNFLSLDQMFDDMNIIQALAHRGHFSLLQEVLQKVEREYVYAASKEGKTALHISAEEGHWNIYDYLIRHFYRNNPIPLDNNGNTPEDLARKAGKVWFLKRFDQNKVVQVVESTASEQEYNDSSDASATESKLLY